MERHALVAGGIESSWRRPVRLAALAALIAAASQATSAEPAAPARVRGRLLDLGGAPVAGTLLVIEEETEQERSDRLARRGYFLKPAARMATDAGGRFDVELPSPDRYYRIDAVSPGRARVHLAEELDGSGRNVQLAPARMPPGTAVTGRVVDAGGAPAIGAVVGFELVPDSYREPRSGTAPCLAETGADGRFVLDGVPEGKGTLTVLAPGHASTVEEETTPRSDRTLRLGPPRSVRGRVVGPGGRPVEGADVYAHGLDGMRARTAKDGSFVLEDVPDGPLVLTTRALRFLPARARVGDPRACTIALEPAGVVDVIVLDAASSRPFPRACVTIGGVRAPTDASGRTVVGELRRGSHDARASAAGCLDAEGHVTVVPGETHALTLRLPRGATVHGSVTDLEGKGIPDVRVQPATPARQYMGGRRLRALPGLRETASDAAGRFEIEGIGDDSLVLVLEAEGYATRELGVGKLAPGAVRDVRVVLDRGGAARGRVLRPDGSPAPGATVKLFRTSRGPRDPERTTSTGPDGTYQLDALATGEGEIAASLAGLLDSLPVVVTVGRDTTATVPDARLRPAWRIQGKVTDEAGQPLQARVEADVREGESGATADGEGRYVLEGLDPDDEVKITASLEGWVSRERRIPGGSTEPVDIVLRRGVTLAGVVRTKPDGRPVTQYRISASTTARGDDVPWIQADVHADDGRFELPDVPRALLDLRVFSGRLAGELSIDAAGPVPQEIVIQLEPGIVVHGVVRSRAGAPLEGALVAVQGAHDASSFTDSRGAFRIDGAPAGVGGVSVFAKDLPTVNVEVEIAPGMAPLDIVVPDGATVRGRVVDPSGVPVPGMAVVAPLLPFEARETTTDAAGAFALPGMAPGALELQAASAEGEILGNATVQVGSQDPPPIEIRLEDAERLEALVTGLAPEELSRVEVRAFSDRLGQRRGRAAGAGLFLLEGTFTGEITVVATFGGRAVNRTVDVRGGGGTVRVELDFAPRGRLSGRVLRRGAPVPDAPVGVVQEARGAWASTTTDGAGRFEVAGLADGRALVIASERGGREHETETTISGDTYLDVVLPEGTIRGRVVDAATGSAIADARVNLLGAGPVWWEAGASTGADGAFTLDGLADGEARLAARAEGHADAELSVTVPAGAPVEFRLAPESPLRLRIVDRRTGEPPASVGAWLLDARGPMSLRVDLERTTDGAFTVPGARGGRTSLLVDAADAAPVALWDLAVPGEHAVAVSGGGSIEVVLAAPGRVCLTTADGRPAFASVMGSPITCQQLGARPTPFGSVAPGRYLLAIEGYGEPKAIDVVEGASTRVHLP